MMDALSEAILTRLRHAPQGIAEYPLLQHLRQQGLLPALSLGDNLALFRTHFRLFNALYRLRDQLHAEGTHSLQISPLCIALRPYLPGHDALASNDPLRDYYLDEQQLEDTDEDDVDRLLKGLWQRLDACAARDEALRVLQLDVHSAPDLATVRRRYRQLAALHHPDRGGDAEHMQHLNQAMEILLRYYR